MVSHLPLQQIALKQRVAELSAGGARFVGADPGPAVGVRVPALCGLLGDEVSSAGVITVNHATGAHAWATARWLDSPQILVRIAGGESEETIAVGRGAPAGALPLPWLSLIHENLLGKATSAGRAGFFLQVGTEVPAGSEEVDHASFEKLIGSSCSPSLVAANTVAVTRALSMLMPDAAQSIREVCRCASTMADPAVSAALISATEDAGDSSGEAAAGFLRVLLAQPATAYPSASLPDGLEIVALRAGRERDGGALERVSVASAMAYRMIAERCGMTIRTGERGDPQLIEDGFFDGHLGNIDPVTFAGDFRAALPKQMRGGEFLDQCGGVSDPQVKIDEDLEYPIRGAAEFVVAENQRACTFVDALGYEQSQQTPAGPSTDGRDPSESEERPGDKRASMLGSQLEHSYLDWRELVSVDADVEFAMTELRKRGADRGILGARPSYGAWPIVALVDRGQDCDADRALCEVQAAYERSYQRTPDVTVPGGGAIEVATQG